MLLKSLNHITLSLTRIDTFDELVYQSIQYGIDLLGFSRLSCWFIDSENPDELVGFYRVNEQGQIQKNTDERMMLTHEHPAYEVIKGSLTARIFYDENIYTHQFEVIGRGDKVFVPLLDGEQAIGCLYADNLIDRLPMNDERVEILNLYGATLGVLFNRQRSRDELKASRSEALSFQNLLKQLNRVIIEISSTESLDDLTYKAVLLGKEKLGFDRIGLWFCDDDDPNIRHGMWGIDPKGHIRDERHVQSTVPQQEATMVSEGDVIVIINNDIYDADGSFIVTGWTLIGLMWDGSKRIGWLYADNAITERAFTPNQYEIFRLYSAQLGLLCAQRIIQDELRQREIYYRAITESSSDIVTIIDSDLRITYISPALKNMVGVEPEQMIGRTVTRVVHPLDVDDVESALRTCLDVNNHQARVNNVRVRHQDGHWVYMEALMTSMIDNPFIRGVVVSCRDLTQRRIAEERQRLAERERERSWLLRQFINDISHDFRTPLSIIGTNAYLLKHSSRDNVDNRIAIIQQQIERMTNLIENMKMIAQLDETSQIVMASTEIGSLIRSAFEILQSRIAGKQLQVTIEIQENLPPIHGNASLLHDAFMHVMDNAIQFNEVEGEIVVRVFFNHEYVIIEVRDTGVGIAQADLPYIFDRLYRADKARNTNSGGGGLGLAITRRILELHGGSIRLQSIEDEGTTVEMRLPPERYESPNR